MREPKCTNPDGHEWSLRRTRTFQGSTFMWLFGETNYQEDTERCRHCNKKRITHTNLDNNTSTTSY
jgi:hypothetical protein